MKHLPKEGRRAYVCRKEGCGRRVFVPQREPWPDPLPECPGHGRMVRQENRPYRGQRVPELPRGDSRRAGGS